MSADKQKIAFVLHPLSVFEFKDKAYFYAPFDSVIKFVLKKIPLFWVKKFFSILPPHIFLAERDIRISDNENVDIMLAMCPLFPEELVLGSEKSHKKILETVNLCEKSGANVVVLGGFTSISTDQGRQIYNILEKKNLLVTSGNALTAAFCLEGVAEAARIFNVRMEESTVAIVGATGDIGSALSLSLSKTAKKLILCSRNISERSKVCADIQKMISDGRVILEKNPDLAVQAADIVLLATSSYFPIVDPKRIKSGALVCDVSLPHNIARSALDRDDIFVFNGGMGKICAKGVRSRKWTAFSFFRNIIPGCLAEGIVLALANSRDGQVLGRGNISTSWMLHLLRTAEDFNIHLSDFFFYDHFYSEEDLKRKRIKQK